MKGINIKIKMFNSEKTFDLIDQDKEEKLRIISQVKKKSTSSGNDKASKFVFLFKLLNKNDA